MNQEEFKIKVRESADKFKDMVQKNRVMIFSATYCSYCTVAKVGWIQGVHGLIWVTSVKPPL